MRNPLELATSTNNMIFIILILIKQQLQDPDSKLIFVYSVETMILIGCLIAQHFERHHKFASQLRQCLSAFTIWQQILLLSLSVISSQVKLQFLFGVVVGHYEQQITFSQGHNERTWKATHISISYLIIFASTTYNLTESLNQMGDPLIILATIICTFVMEGFKIPQQDQKYSSPRTNEPLDSPSQSNIMIYGSQSPDNAKMISMSQVPFRPQEPQSQDVKWETIVETGIDSWFLKVNVSKETRVLDVSKMNSPLARFLQDRQTTITELFSKINIKELQSYNPFTSLDHIQLDTDVSLHSLLLLWFDEDLHVVDKAVPVSTYRDPTIKLGRQQTLVSKRPRGISVRLEKQTSQISQIQGPPESRMRLESSFQSNLLKDELSQLVSRPTYKNKQQFPCVLNIDDKQLHLLATIISYEKNEFTGEVETFVTIENNHAMFALYNQAFNLAQRLQICDRFVRKQSENVQKVLARLVQEKRLMNFNLSSKVILCFRLPSLSQQVTSNEKPEDSAMKREGPAFSFCADDEQEPQRQNNNNKPDTKDNKSGNTLNLPQVPSSNKSSSSKQRRVSEEEGLNEEYNKCNSQEFQRLQESFNSTQQYYCNLLHHLLQQVFVCINNSYNFLDFFVVSQEFTQVYRFKYVKSSFKITEVVQNILDILKHHENIEKYKIELCLDRSKLKQETIQTDKRRVKQIFLNLILNGIQSFVQRPDFQQRNHVTVELSDEDNPRYIYVSITNNGREFNSEILDSVQRVNEGKFGLFSVDRCLDILGPPDNTKFKMKNLEYPEECQVTFQLCRKLKRIQHADDL